MDFFDVRKLTVGQTKEVLTAGNASIADYSAVAFLPVIMIAAVVLGICGVCQYKRWKHEKKQIAHLNDFYEVLEGPSFKYGKMIMVENSDMDKKCCDRIRRAMVLPPTESSPFFQPTNKPTVSRFDIPRRVASAAEANDHLYHSGTQKVMVNAESLVSRQPCYKIGQQFIATAPPAVGGDLPLHKLERRKQKDLHLRRYFGK
ncbi:hypothetical protein Q1695_006427 [Nippostrongylus brasiliensis]|nr:hypothetical protein Q1695_006427 [Nippostrongylus brasiliensis]